MILEVVGLSALISETKMLSGVFSGSLDLPIDNVAGLPLHPLVVHAAVVLVPLAAVGLILMAASPTRSKRYSPLILVVAGLGALSAFGAMLTGDQIANEIGLRNAQHYDYGDILPWVALVQFLIGIGLALLDRKRTDRSVAGVVLAIVCVVVAVGAIVGTVLAGHSGAELVWG
jgi:hypothetical protein